ncbi:MAG: DUF4397 domain-containing protein [Bradymonadia bacterium]
MGNRFSPRFTLLSCLLTSLLGVGLTGCGEEQTPADPQAKVVMMHTSGVLGEVVFRVNDEVVARLRPGAMTEPVSLPVGPVDLSIRAPGAATNLIDERIDLRAQPYVVAVVGQQLSDLQFWKVDEPAPDLAEGESALKVVNLDHAGYTYDVYVEDAEGVRRPLVKALGYNDDSRFTELSLPTSAVGTPEHLKVRLLGFDIGDNPEGRPEMSVDLELVDGVPYMALIQSDPQTDTPFFSIITAR